MPKFSSDSPVYLGSQLLTMSVFVFISSELVIPIGIFEKINWLKYEISRCLQTE